MDIINSYIDSGFGWLITIGDNDTITNATILAHDASTKRFLGYSRVGRVSIGDYSFVGAGAIVLPGVSIGERCVVGAGSVVTRDVPDGAVARYQQSEGFGYMFTTIKPMSAINRTRPSADRSRLVTIP